MARNKTRTVICALCGGEFESASSHAKHCPACRPLAIKLNRKRNAEKYQPKRDKKDSIIEMGDSPKRRAICLSCEAPDCKGWCSKLKEG